MADLCKVCGNKIGAFTNIEIKDGYICKECQRRSLGVTNGENLTSQDYKDRFKYLDENKKLLSVFTPTISIEDYLQVDETNKLFQIANSEEIFPFSCLVNFELIEDGETISKGGLGRAIVGGALFGGVGAIVGGVTGGKKSKSFVNSMYIRISLNDEWVKNTQITFIETKIKKSGFVYSSCKKCADQIISALEIILKNQQTTNCEPSSADELLKFKQLLDMDAISKDEYEIKKKQLLGL